MDSIKRAGRLKDSNKEKEGKKQIFVSNMMSRKMTDKDKLKLNKDLAGLSIDLNIPVNQIISP